MSGTLNDVREIHFYLEKLHGLSLSANQFEEMISIKQSESVTSQAIFEVIDQNCDGRIDGLEFIGGLILCCQGSFEEKARRKCYYSGKKHHVNNIYSGL